MQLPDTPLLVIATTIIVLVVSSRLYAPSILRFFRRKKYQYEVTFALYMMTPAEQFILNSLLFLTFSMIIIATLLYLPEHVLKISNRAIYYYSGSGSLKSSLYSPPLPAASSAAAAAAVAAVL